MKYKITIVSFGDNPNYEAELAEVRERETSCKRGPFSDVTFPEDTPSRMKKERVLEVFLTEEEFKKIKSEVIKVFE